MRGAGLARALLVLASTLRLRSAGEDGSRMSATIELPSKMPPMGFEQGPPAHGGDGMARNEGFDEGVPDGLRDLVPELHLVRVNG